MSSKKTSNYLPNPHDAFFRQVFSRKEEAQDFLRGVLPPALLQHLDLDTLKLENTSYLNRQLKSRFSDIVYSTTYRAKAPLKLAFLWEHKSFKPDKIPIQGQLLQYIQLIWEQNQKQDKALMPVIPIVVYHGSEAWEAQSLRSYFQESYQLPSESPLLAYLPDFEYLFTDLGKYTDEETRAIFSVLSLQSALITLKMIFDSNLPQAISRMRQEIIALIQDERGRDFYEQILLYLYYSSQTDKLKIIEVMENISQAAGQTARSTAEMLILQGRQEGKKEGLKEGFQESLKKLILSGLLSLEQIAEVYELPLEYIQSIAKGLKKAEG